MSKKIDNTETNREKFFSYCTFQAGKEIGNYNQIYQAGEKMVRVIELNTGRVIPISSITDHSFSFLDTYFGQTNLITVFFSELVFIPEPAEPMEDPDNLPGSLNELKP
jgi:hypothetical protein